MTEPLGPGVRVGGRFEVQDLLGRGAFGEVYAAHDVATEQRVALKVLSPLASAVSELDDPTARFEREAELARRVRHPNVVRTYGKVPVGANGSCIVMEALEGENLERRLARRGPLNIEAVVKLGIAVADALAAVAEQRIVHRDVKPANVFLARRAGGAEHVKLIDFGLALDLSGASPAESSHAIFGTPDYMAPEQLRGQPTDERADVYALGAVLYEALTGRPPHQRQSFNELVVAALNDPIASIRECRPDCPPELEAVILRALAREPERRLCRAADLRDALFAVPVQTPEAPRAPAEPMPTTPVRRIVSALCAAFGVRTTTAAAA